MDFLYQQKAVILKHMFIVNHGLCIKSKRLSGFSDALSTRIHIAGSLSVLYSSDVADHLTASLVITRTKNSDVAGKCGQIFSLSKACVCFSG